MNKIFITVFFLLLATSVYADFNSPFSDFGSNTANTIFTDTGSFNDSGILGASDTTVQRALQSLSENASDVTAIEQCDRTDNYCYEYSPTTLTLWMSNNQVHDWTVTLADAFLLLDDGISYILLDDGVSKIIIK